MRVAILCGTVYGTAEEVAHHVQDRLRAEGHVVWLDPRGTLDALMSFDPEILLAVSSTTGMGELPDNIQPLYYALRDRLPDWRGRLGAVLGLGDSSYGDTYCGGGMHFQELFTELGLQILLPMLRLDASETVTPDTDADPWLDDLIAALTNR
ncbi:MioC protein [Pseudomonas duriflava]|uniref:MioC protein n=1 Tax=Pseudomonas duriflava TaxID=459528 RepID=A0A562QQE5_9PSED|nr:flavodoxin [Pseudomonas duriflava]TWI58420.1 MioC protein [Pseudomonas duriflava]